jgi:hypothetical protein
MTYRDPNEPLGTDSPTEAYRAPTPSEPSTTTPPPTTPWPGQPEPATTPAATTSAVGTRTGGRPNRTRWAVAGIVIALVIAGSGLAAVLLTGKAPDASVLGWVPKDSLVYGEMRLDLPGDQRANLGEFLSKFPGFKDQAALDTKINEVLDRVVSEASSGDQTYTADIAPWFDGEIALSMGELPDPSALENPDAVPPAPDAVAYLSLKDGAKAQAWFDDLITGDETTTESYGGTTLTVTTHSDATDSYAFGIVPSGTVALMGRTDSVKAALDTNGAGGLAEDETFAAALASAEDDHVGYMFLNMRAYMDWVLSMAPAEGGDMCGTSFSDDISNLVPAWVATSLRVEGDALVFGATAPMVADPPVDQENRASSLAKRLPATTLFFAEGHDVGEVLTGMIDMYRDDPACAEAFQQIDLAVGFLGGFDDLLGWMEDGAIVFNRTPDGVEGGLVFQAANADDASDLLDSIKSLLGLAGASGPSVREEAHGDARITILDLGDAASLHAMGGGMTGLPVPAPGDSGDRVELAWTVSGDTVVFGVGSAFVKSVLDTDEASSLASNARYTALLDRVGGASNVGVVYADLTAMRELVEGLIGSEVSDMAEYEAEAKPFLAPFDAFIQAAVIADGEVDSTSLITVK